MLHVGLPVAYKRSAVRGSAEQEIEKSVMACRVHLPERKFKTLLESFTEGSKSVCHLPRYLSIQRNPKFLSAYHH